jgi:LysM repeat protein
MADLLAAVRRPDLATAFIRAPRNRPIIRSMTDRGLPIVDGAPACPFVAFDDDRDARDTAPDHRHRCYAEVRPAPRALAHQEAYCLSSAFPVCPTFQDWARREAAQARAPGAPGGPEGDHEAPAGPVGGPDQAAASTGAPGRNPHRDWAAPPPWLNDRGREAEDDEPEIQALPRAAGGGLAGSFADRMVGGSTPRATLPAARRDADAFEGDDEEDEDDDEDAAPARRAAPPATSRGSVPTARAGSRAGSRDAGHGATGGTAPSWERPRRLEAYPTLKTRLGLPALSVPPILVGVGAVALAAVALFFLPALLGVGNPPDSGAGPSPSASASAGASGTPAPPTPVPGPTLQVYVVESGDTMSRIAARFGVPLTLLVEANAENIPNPDLLKPGDQVFIPNVAPTSLPDAGTVTEAPSPAP